ncbi:Signal recognition particle subunit SRP72 [Rhinocladiella similis]
MTASSSALAALLKKSTLDDHEQILDACNKTLKSSRSDLEAQHVKLVALLKSDRYEEAVKFAEAAGDNLRRTAALEYAYALYKTGRLEEAVTISSEIQSRGARHLEAQARYRLEDSLATSELYQRLRNGHDEAEGYDLRVNQGAIDAQGQWIGVSDVKSIRRPGREDLEAFETAYNAACGSIAREEYAQAEVLLKRAKELCRHSEDLTDQQKKDELLPIAVQQLYVLLCQGKSSDAEAIASEIIVEDASDLSTRQIAQNNLLLTRGTDNPFLAYKQFHATDKIPPDDKLFSFQSTPLKSNQATLDLQAFKFDGLKSSKRTPRQSGISSEDLISSFSKATAVAGNETGKAAIRKILSLLENQPNDIGIIITLIQLYVLNGDSTSAVELMESFLKRLEQSAAEHEQEIRYNPLLVSLLISLYKHRKQKGHVKKELARAAAYWRTQSNPPVSLLTAAGVSLLESHDEADTKLASEIFTRLKEQQPDDKATAAGYVASHAAAESSSQLKSDIDKLTPVEDLVREVDVGSIERAGIPQSSNALAIAQLGRSKKRGAPDTGDTKAKRIRKSRLPKDFDENKKPDPERWLPMKDRSYYRPPKGKKRAKRGGDTQGGVVNEELNVDAKAAAPVASGSGGNKKKKGKGRK